MEKSIIKNLIDKGYSTWKISKTLNFSQTNIRYWLKKYKLKTNLTSKKDNNTEELFQVTDRKCPKCKEVKSVENFYNRRNGKGNSVYCKKCSNKEVTNRQRKFKEKCVAYKVGTYPKRAEIYTGQNVQSFLPDKTQGLDLGPSELIILQAAKSLKSSARPKFHDKYYDILISKGLLKSNRSITIDGMNLLLDPEIQEKVRQAAELFRQKTGRYFSY